MSEATHSDKIDLNRDQDKDIYSLGQKDSQFDSVFDDWLGLVA
jgi:hypothetical protein